MNAEPLVLRPGLKPLACAGLIAAAAVLAYLPSVSGGFIMDDDVLVTGNPLINSSDGLYRIWCTTEPVDYWPLTNSSFWIEWRLWGMNPTGYHVTNLVLHIASALLIWVILGKLSIPGAWLAALLFAVHPVNVESVAWISQRKNTLSMLFFLLSILWYLKADRGVGLRLRRERSAERRWYALSLLAFILAMLSKGSVAILPLVLLLIAWWQHGQVSKWDLARTAPFFVVSVVLAAVNVWFQTHGSGQAIRDVTFLQRLLGAGGAVWFYLYKALLPVNLVFVYPQWDVQSSDWRWWVPLLATLGVTALLVWKRGASWGGPLLFAWLFFCASLLPVMGFTDVGFMKFSLVADRYLHIAVIGVLALVAAGVGLLYQRLRGPARSAAVATATLAVTVLALLSWQQSSLYADAITLYETTLVENPDSWLIHNNLGDNFDYLGRTDEALKHYQQALTLNPDYPEAHNNLGNVLLRSGHLQEALEHYEQSLRLKPNNPQAHNNFGNALADSGQLPEAISHYEESLRLMPGFAVAHNNLGNALSRSGRLDEARERYQEALRLRPDYAEAHYNLGVALSHAGRHLDAIDAYRQALRLRPDYLEAHVNFGAALFQSGQYQQAIEQFQQVLRLDPDFPDAHYNLGQSLEQAGRLQEAIESYQQALRLRPDDLAAYVNLAAAHAQAGQISEAVSTMQHALDVAQSSGQTTLAQQIEARLNKYRSLQPGGGGAAPQPGTSK